MLIIAIVVDCQVVGQARYRAGRVVVGRSWFADLTLADPTLPAYALQLASSPHGVWHVVGLHPTQAISLNGVPVEGATLRSGDAIAIGATRVTVVASPGVPGITPRRPAKDESQDSGQGHGNDRAVLDDRRERLGGALLASYAERPCLAVPPWRSKRRFWRALRKTTGVLS